MKAKTIPILFILSLVMFTKIYAQIIELTFTAEHNSQYIALDSIYVKNLTQGGDTVLYYPDTVLHISSVGIFDYGYAKNNLSVLQNYPNPFFQSTTINIYLPENEFVAISVFDILGRKLTTFKNNLNAGNHSFTFYPCKEQFYIFSVSTKHEQKTIKMLGYGNITNDNCKIIYEGIAEKAISLKSVKSNFIFSYGDYLSYTGYATISGNKGSGFIEDNPTNDESYIFDIGEDGIPCPDMPTVTDIDVNVYQTVRIGSQCWLAENLKTTRYRDGTDINYPGSNNPAWSNDTFGAYAWHNNDTTYKNTYGALYNWFAVNNTSGLCPAGWHVPTDAEWCILENYVERNTDSYCNIMTPDVRGINTGRILKSCRTTFGTDVPSYCVADEHPKWDYHINTFGIDSYGFSALPGGWRVSQLYSGPGDYGFWWTASESEYDNSSGIRRTLYYEYPSIFRGDSPKSVGYSVRCLKN